MALPELHLLQVSIHVDHQSPQLEEEILEVGAVEHVVGEDGEPAQQGAPIPERADIGEGMPLLAGVEDQQRIAYGSEALAHRPPPETDVGPGAGSGDGSIQGPKSIRHIGKHTCHEQIVT